MKTKEALTMPERMTGTIIAEHLPPEFRAKIPPVPGRRYRVTVEEIEETDEERLAELRAHIQAAIDDPRPSIPGDVVFAEARARIEEKRRARLAQEA